MTALIFGIIQGNELGWTSVESLAVFATSAVLIGAFVPGPCPTVPERGCGEGTPW